MTNPPPDPVALLAERLAGAAAAQRIYLFGLRARGDAGPRSDIDLAVAAPMAAPGCWHRILDLIEDMPTLLHIDVTRLEEASAEFRDEILR